MTNAAIRYLGIQFTPSPFLTGIVAVSSSSSSGCAAGCGGEGVCWQSDDITGNGWSLSHSPEALPRLAPLPRSVAAMYYLFIFSLYYNYSNNIEFITMLVILCYYLFTTLFQIHTLMLQDGLIS